MGVPHLQFYVQTKCPDASYDMDIFNFAKDKPDAAVIVDASTLSYKLSEDLDLICGGQGMVNRCVAMFIQTKEVSIGIHLR